MNSKRIQLLFFLGISAITLHYSILFFKEWIHYLSLNQKASAHINQWEIIPIKNQFALKVDFSFPAQEKTWQASFTFPSPYYLNEWAALTELKKKAKKSWTAYYNNPNGAVLEKSFPVALLIKMGICVGVVAYFFILRRNTIYVH